MARRLELHDIFCGILGSDEVYFQPPESLSMSYPSIVYSISRLNRNHADNIAYRQAVCYEVIVIDYDPDSEIAEAVSKLEYCDLERTYASDNLNHFVFTLYY